MIQTRIVFAPAGLAGDFHYLAVDALGSVIRRGVLPIGQSPPEPTRDVMVISGEDALARWLHLPMRNPRQLAAAARLQLADQLALADEDLHLAFGPLEADGFRLVTAIRRDVLQAWLGAAGLHGLQPAVLIPDHLVLPEPAVDAELITAGLGDSLLARGRRLAMSLEPETAPLVLAGRPAQALDAGGWEAALIEAARRPAVNLLQGDLDVGQAGWSARAWRRAAVLAAVLLVSPLLLQTTHTVRTELAARSLERVTAARVAAVLPAGTVVDDPAVQARLRLEALQLAAGAGPAGLVSGLFTALEPIDQAQLESLVLGPDGLRATIRFAQISDTELFRQAMRTQGLAYREEGVRDEAGRVVADVMLGQRR
jgi:general secretion pathway protein L